MIYSLGEKRVTLQGEHYIAPNATVLGDVVVGHDVSIWFNAVIRADCAAIVIGDGSNIQDGSVLHADPGYPLTIGRGVTVGHKVMLHGCTIGDNCLVGINAVILNGAVIGNNCLIGANTLVPENMVIPDGSLVVGSPAKIKRALDEKMLGLLKQGAEHYVENGRQFKCNLKEDVVTND